VQRARGRLDAAERTCLGALEFAAGSDRQVVPAAGPAFTGLAQIAYQRNELDTAIEAVESAIAAGRQFVHTPPLAAALTVLAWVRQARGDADGAREAMTEAGRAALGPGGLFNSVPAQRARLLLAQGEVTAAARWTRERGLDPDDAPDYPREIAYLVLARVLLAQGEPERALRILDRVHAAAVAQNRGEAVIEAGALRALALADAGRRTESIAVLAESLERGHPQRYIRVFADEGAPMAALLGQLFADRREGRSIASIPIGYLVAVRQAIDAGNLETRPSAPTDMLEPLTSREHEVLGLLADGASNHAIAATLFITLDTVKKHVSHILRKLGARNRTEAVALARESHLIS
jgi:LuxR family maltose regulon positive regulatory protein